MKTVEIYTDGACSGNPGPGGWASVLICGDKIKEIAGFEPQTTNNRMELLAIIKALEALKAPCQVNLYSDSSYCVNAVNQKWLVKWQSNGWRASGSAVKNQDLWHRLLELLTTHKVTFIKVKGHSDNKYNNRCDELAVNIIKSNVANDTKIIAPNS